MSTSVTPSSRTPILASGVASGSGSMSMPSAAQSFDSSVSAFAPAVSVDSLHSSSGLPSYVPSDPGFRSQLGISSVQAPASIPRFSSQGLNLGGIPSSSAPVVHSVGPGPQVVRPLPDSLGASAPSRFWSPWVVTSSSSDSAHSANASDFHGSQFPQDEDPDILPVDSSSADAQSKANSRMYRHMIDYITGMFPQARGQDLSQQQFRSLFEQFYAVQSDSLPPLPKLNWFDRIFQSLQEADNRLASVIENKKLDSSILPPIRSIYAVANNNSKARPLPLNDSMEALLSKVPQSSRLSTVSIKDCGHLESTFRAQNETLSHSMWVLTALIAFLKSDGYSPSDPALFNQFITSMSMGLSHVSNAASSGTSFLVKKRRDSYLSHLPPVFADVSKRSLLRSPANLATSLFLESDVSDARNLSQAASTFQSQQALVEVASRGRSSPNRGRSPSRSPRSGRRYRQGSNSPKRVRYADAKSPPPSSFKKQNFAK